MHTGLISTTDTDCAFIIEITMHMVSKSGLAIFIDWVLT